MIGCSTGFEVWKRIIYIIKNIFFILLYIIFINVRMFNVILLDIID